MKYILSIFSISAIALFLICGTTSCKKTNNSTAASNDTATLFLHLHTDIGANEVDSLGELYPDTLGRAIGLTLAQFYISNISLTNTDGSIYNMAGTYVLKTIGNETYQVGTIPAGNYTSISFSVGVDPGTNATNPSTYTAPNPLASQTPTMWFGNVANGYIFMNIQGFAQDSTGKPVVPISYQIGSNGLYESVSLPVHNPTYTVAAKQSLTVHLICDYGRLLRTVTSFSTNSSTDTYTTNPTLAKTIAGGIPNMFYYEE